MLVHQLCFHTISSCIWYNPFHTISTCIWYNALLGREDKDNFVEWSEMTFDLVWNVASDLRVIYLHGVLKFHAQWYQMPFPCRKWSIVWQGTGESEITFSNRRETLEMALCSEDYQSCGTFRTARSGTGAVCDGQDKGERVGPGGPRRGGSRPETENPVFPAEFSL